MVYANNLLIFSFIYFLLYLTFTAMSKEKDKKLTEAELKAIKAKKDKNVQTQQIINK